MKSSENLEVNWRERYREKEISAEDAIKKIIPGNRVFISSGCSEPQELTLELIKQAETLIDTEIIHFLTIFPEKYFKEKEEDKFRHNALFIGDTLREEVNSGQADYTPINVSEISALFLSGRKYIDVALIQVTPPDRYGFCSFGINIDIAKPIAQSAYHTIAEINPQMPRTLGNSFIHMKEIDYYVYNDQPLLEYRYKEGNEVSERIGKNVANLIQNKATISIGFGDLPNECLKYLMEKKDLGMHSHFITDNVIPLIEKTVLTCRKKNFRPEKIITSFALGTKKLYDFLDNNPYIEFYPSDYVSNPRNISMNNNMVSINQAMQIDLTGQLNNSTKEYKFNTGFGSTLDFTRGAALSKGGKPIIVLPSTSPDGSTSNIVSHLDENAGVYLTRADVHYIVTEWGVAYLHGKTIRDRVIELISVAHPKFRAKLLEEAKRLKYIYSDQILPVDENGNVCLYPKQYETHYTTKDNEKLFIRPVKTTDEALLKELYYSLNQKDRYLRFFEHRKEFSHSKTQCEVNVDYEKIFSIAAFYGEGSSLEMVGNAAYFINPKKNYMAELSFMVNNKWRSKGIASFLIAHMIIIAKEKGLRAFYGNILIENKTTIRIIQRAGKCKMYPPEAGENDLYFELFFFPEDKDMFFGMT